MRRISVRQALSLSQESANIISMEEEAILLTEASQDLAEAEEISKDTTRLEDVADALDSMVEVADTIEEAKPSDLIMIETASRLAVAGSDVDAEEITPALEQYMGGKISMEGVREVIKSIWEAIKNAIKKVYEKIESFFYKIIGTIPRVRKSIEAVRKRMGKLNNKTIKETKTKLGSEINALSVAGRAPHSGSDMANSMKNMADQVNFFMYDRTKDIIKMGDAMVDAFNSYDPAKGLDGLKAMIGAVNSVRFTDNKLNKHQVKGDSRFSEGEYFVFAALPGGTSVYLRDGKKSSNVENEGGLELGQAEAQRRTVYSVQSSTSKTSQELKDAEIGTLSFGDIDNILAQCERILSSVENYNRSPEWKKVKATRDKIEQAGKKMTDKTDSSKELTSVELSYYRSTIKYANYFKSFSTQPMASLANQALRSVRASIVASNKSLSNYA